MTYLTARLSTAIRLTRVIAVPNTQTPLATSSEPNERREPGTGAPAAPAGASYQADLSGSGAIAQGEGAVAIGAGGVYVGGNASVIVQAPRQRPPAPFQAPAPAADHVPRPRELAQLKRHLLDGAGQLLPNTVGLHGFGGSGKTILARLVCADPDVRAACADGILWVGVGKTPPDPKATMTDLVIALTGQCNGCATLPGARGQLQAALAGRKLLLVLDDVWNAAHVKDLVEASDGCARLITTRNPLLLPRGARLVELGPMQPEIARRVAGRRAAARSRGAAGCAGQAAGYWPVLLSLANGTLRYRIDQQNTHPATALDDAENDLKRQGVVAFDPDGPYDPDSPRELAVAATVEASLDLLKPDQRRCYSELAIFPPDVPIPLARVGAALATHRRAGL